jgi:alkanesulfonate monooxygenase SsuD/methylene tetrahydromethanopterin reductase-like flavin-dependent oxidoreductase (luciferase family)
VLIQSGDSNEGREFGARTADAIFSRHGTIEAGQAFYQDLKGRMPRYGRRPEEITILPATTFALGDTEAEARENAERVRREQVSPQTAIAFLEQVWGRDLSAYDPDGPLPDVEPDPGATITRGRVRHEKDPVAVATAWRELAAAKGGLSIRELIIETTARQSFVGTPKQVAAQMDEYVQQDASDGFILVPHLVPGGLDEFVDKVIPELQDLGSFRTAYTGPTLRDHLGLAKP